MRTVASTEAEERRKLALDYAIETMGPGEAEEAYVKAANIYYKYMQGEEKNTETPAPGTEKPLTNSINITFETVQNHLFYDAVHQSIEAVNALGVGKAILVHNDIELTITPDSCVQELEVAYDAIYELAKRKTETEKPDMIMVIKVTFDDKGYAVGIGSATEIPKSEAWHPEEFIPYGTVSEAIEGFNNLLDDAKQDQYFAEINKLYKTGNYVLFFDPADRAKAMKKEEKPKEKKDKSVCPYLVACSHCQCYAKGETGNKFCSRGFDLKPATSAKSKPSELIIIEVK